MDKVTCPYCEEECEINHDDGAFYNEDEQEEMQCEHCDKYFMVATSISYYHEGYKAPCKNGEPHDWQPIHGIPIEIFKGKERCSYCDEERDTYTPEQRQKAHNDYVEYLNKKYPKERAIKNSQQKI